MLKYSRCQKAVWLEHKSSLQCISVHSLNVFLILPHDSFGSVIFPCISGIVMHKVYLFLELSVTLVMYAMVELTQVHQMMVSQANHVLKGHSAPLALLSLIPVPLVHTVRVLVEQVIRTVFLAILDITVREDG